jgi:hypothetical protein
MGWVSPKTAVRLRWAREAMEHAEKRLADARSEANRCPPATAASIDAFMRVTQCKTFVAQARTRLRHWMQRALMEIRDEVKPEPVKSDLTGLPMFDRSAKEEQR